MKSISKYFLFLKDHKIYMWIFAINLITIWIATSPFQLRVILFNVSVLGVTFIVSLIESQIYKPANGS